MSQTFTIPFVGSIIANDTGFVLSGSPRGQQFTNVLFRRSANDISGGSKIEGRPIRTFATINAPSGSGRGTAVTVWTGKGTGETIVSAFGSTNSTIYSGSTSLGAITGTVEFFSETTITGTPNVVAIASNGRAWYYPDAGSLTEITDTDFPPKQTPALTPTGNFVHMDGYSFIACTNGQIWNSDLNSISSWTALNYVTASDKTDGLLGIAKKGDYIWAFGLVSAQAFYNAGNATGSPLSPVKGAAFAIGAMNQYTILQFRDTIAWVGFSTENGAGVYVLDGNSPRKVSTSLVDEFIAGAGYLKLHQFVDGGKHLLFLGSHGLATSGAAAGYMYDLDLNLWTPARFSGLHINQTAIRREAAGYLYTVAVDDDITSVISNYNGAYATAIAVLGPIGDGSSHSIDRIQLIGDGFGSSGSDMDVSISVNHTDRDTGFSTARTVTMDNPVAHRFGYARRGQSRIKISWDGGTDDEWISGVRVTMSKYG